MRNPGLRPRHWTDLGTLFGHVLSPESLTLTQLLEMNVQAQALRIEEICTAAEKEYQLDSQVCGASKFCVHVKRVPVRFPGVWRIPVLCSCKKSTS